MKENVYINQIVRFLCLRKINIHMNKELVNLHEKKKTMNIQYIKEENNL